jgi:hypothetical protein
LEARHDVVDAVGIGVDAIERITQPPVVMEGEGLPLEVLKEIALER